MKMFPGVLCGYVLCAFSAFADSFMGDEFGRVVNIRTNSVVHEYVRFVPGTVNVSDTVKFTNYGFVDTNFKVCEFCDIQIINYGEFVADFDLENGANVVQIVSDLNTANPISSNVEYTLVFDGADGVRLDGVWDVGALNALVFKDSVIDISNVDFSEIASVDLLGENLVVIDDLSVYADGVIIPNVSGNGAVQIQVNNTNPLYSVIGDVDNGVLVAKMVRETDYVKVLKNDTGVFLNNLRAENPDDGLLRSLDVAVDMDSLSKIMADSVRFNPNKLLNPVRILDVFNQYRVNDETDSGVGLSAIISDDFLAYGMNLDVVERIGKIKFGAGLRVGNIDYQSTLDAFGGVFYGVSLYADYLMENSFFVCGAMNIAKFDFDVANVFYENRVQNTPSVLSMGGLFDLGYKYSLSDSFYVAPFVGGEYVGYIVAGVNDSGVHGRVGVNAGYTYQMLGIGYDYGVGINANSDKEMMVKTHAGFWSDYDGVGANVAIAVVRMFDIYSYQLSIGARFVF